MRYQTETGAEVAQAVRIANPGDTLKTPDGESFRLEEKMRWLGDKWHPIWTPDVGDDLYITEQSLLEHYS